jgi:hypothetical protein
LLEGPFAVMFRLIGDVGANLRYIDEQAWASQIF